MRVAIALGSNLGDRIGTLQGACRRLRAEPGLRLLAVSKFYETSPVGGPDGQGAYLNAAALLETEFAPEVVLTCLQRIEREFGRQRSIKDGPRTLDLDLLLYGDQVINEPELTVPHPRLHERAFVLVPLNDLPEVAAWLHPIRQQTLAELLAQLPEAERVDPRAVRQDNQSSTTPLTFAGQTVFVTGSTTGIGAAIATAFEQRGARVLRHGRKPRADHDYLSGNLAEPNVAERLAEQAWHEAAGALDVLVCNAGADTLTGEAAHWSFERKLSELLAVDLVGTMMMSRALGTRMKQRGRGVILTVGWDQAETGMEGDSGQLFAAVKGAIMCFTRSLALSLAPEVRVNNLAPGWIRTAWGETASSTWQERVRRETPRGIWGLPQDIAEVACFAADPAAHFLTAQTFRINGGAVRL